MGNCVGKPPSPTVAAPESKENIPVAVNTKPVVKIDELPLIKVKKTFASYKGPSRSSIKVPVIKSSALKNNLKLKSDGSVSNK
jgi:hypothetical protein